MRAVVAQSFAAQFEDDIVVFVHGDRPPADDEWRRVVAEYQRAPAVRGLRVLVYTTGGAPTATQRADMINALGGAQPRIAILTSSVIARGAAATIALFVNELRVFDAYQLETALDHLQLCDHERSGARSTLETLRNDLSMRSSIRRQ